MIKRTLYFGNPAYLSKKAEQLVIKLPEVEQLDNYPEQLKEEAITSLSIEDIGLLVIDHQRITLSSGLVASLLENNAAVLFCAGNHMPAGMLLNFDANDTFAEKNKYQIQASEPLKKQLWRQTIEAKILNQATVLDKMGYSGQALRHMATKVNSGDTANTEGHAAARYWQLLLQPYQTTRGQHEGPPNHMLNYGYALLRAVLARSLVGSGCLPVLGIHHHNKYNAYCLADDIMEPYRPVVDNYIFEVVLKKYDKPQEIPLELNKELKTALLQIPQLDVCIEGKQSPLMVAAQRTTASLMRCYMGESRKILYPELQ
jgi:CRISP-associated protein Cas1